MWVEREEPPTEEAVITAWFASAAETAKLPPVGMAMVMALFRFSFGCDWCDPYALKMKIIMRFSKIIVGVMDVGGGVGDYVAGTAYIREPTWIRYFFWHDILPGTGIFPRHLILDVATCRHPFG